MDLVPDHVGLVVSDLDRSIAFYEALGFAVESSLVPSAGRSLTFMRLGDFRLELFWYEQPPLPMSDASTGPRLGFRHFALHVGDLDATVTSLKDIGVIAPDAAIREVMGRYRLLFITDPDGLEVELSQDIC